MKNKKIIPQTARFFLTDEVRYESNNKPILLGFYPDDVVVVPLPDDEPNPDKDHPLAIEGLTILTAFFEGQGSFQSRVKLTAPNGEFFESNHTVIQSEMLGTMINYTKMNPFPVIDFGKYRFTIALDDKEYDYEFEIRRGLIS